MNTVLHLWNIPRADTFQIAQRHGLFAANEGQILDMSLFEAVPDMEMRWKAWSRVESAKRYVLVLSRLSDIRI